MHCQNELKSIRKIDQLTKPRYENMLKRGYDGINSVTLKYAEFKATGVLHKAVHSFMRKYFGGWVLDKYKYGDIMKHFITPEDYMDRIYPQLIPRRDRSPRSGRKAMIYYNSTPELFEIAGRECGEMCRKKRYGHRLFF